jgi:hypothetical protein
VHDQQNTKGLSGFSDDGTNERKPVTPLVTRAASQKFDTSRFFGRSRRRIHRPWRKNWPHYYSTSTAFVLIIDIKSMITRICSISLASIAFFTFQACPSSAFTIGQNAKPRSNQRWFVRRTTAFSDSNNNHETIAEPSYTSLLTSTCNSSSNGAMPVLLNFTLAEHRPLGCTIEESLAASIDGNEPQGESINSQNQGLPYVFVSKVQPESLAQIAGLQVGDVVVGTTGLFGQILDVTLAGIDKMYVRSTMKMDIMRET